MEIRRSGNFGIIDTGSDKGLISFSIGGRGKGWEPSGIQLNRRGAFFSRKISVNGTFIVPMGDNNDMPGVQAYILLFLRILPLPCQTIPLPVLPVFPHED